MENYNALNEEIGVYQKEFTDFCNEKLKEFKDSSDSIAFSASASIKETIETLNEKLRSSSNAEKLINDFNLEVEVIFSKAQSDLLICKNDFYETLNDETIEEIKDIIESKKQEALLQINKSENAAVYKLTETYDLGVSTILSAEKTSLSNLKLLTEELIESLKLSSEGIDKKIQEKLESALKEIAGLENDIINSIRNTEASIKKELKSEASKIVSEMEDSLEQIKVSMENYSVLLKNELTEHKDLLLKEIGLDKENFFIEMDREKNRIIEEIRILEYQIHTNLSKREQEIISNIISVIDGYDIELEIIKQAKINEFIEAIRYIYEEAIKSFNDTIDNCNTQLEEKTLEYIKTLLDKCNEHIKTLQNLTNTHSETLLSLKEKLSKVLLKETNDHKIDVTNTTDDCIKKIGTTDDAMYNEDIPSVRKDAIDSINKKKEDNVDSIVEEASDLIKEYISNIGEQRYTCKLPSNTSIIQLPDDFTLSDRVRVYINGILLIIYDHYTVDKLNRTITLKETYSVKSDVHITEDLPDANIQKIKDQLYVDGEEYKKNTLRLFEDETTRHTTNFDNHIEDKKVEFDEYADNTAEVVVNKYIEETTKPMIDTYVETDSYIKINAHTELKEKQLDDYIEETSKKTIDEYVKNTSKPDIENHSEIKKEEISEYTNTTGINIIRDYIASLAEQQFYCEHPGGISLIQLPYDFATSSKTRVFINGQLQMLGKHYTIDKETNIINLVTPYATKVEVFVITDFATNEYSELTSKVKNLEELVEMLKKQIDSLKNGGTSN